MDGFWIGKYRKIPNKQWERPGKENGKSSELAMEVDKCFLSVMVDYRKVF
jgi:hypothetical protein